MIAASSQSKKQADDLYQFTNIQYLVTQLVYGKVIGHSKLM